MKKQARDLTVTQQWERLPSARRHLYFYIMLLLAMLLAQNLRDASKKPKRLVADHKNPPGITAKEVYPAPVKP